MITYLSLLLLILLAHPVLHWYLIVHKQQYIDYPLHNLLASAAILSSSMVGLALGVYIVEVLLVLVNVPFARWLLHDSILNYLRDLPLNYLGERAKTDQILRNIWEQYHIAPIVVKTTAFATSLTLTIILSTL